MSNKIKILILNVKSCRRIFCLSNFILTLDFYFPLDDNIAIHTKNIEAVLFSLMLNELEMHCKTINNVLVLAAKIPGC